MDCACIRVYRKEKLDESFREVLRKYQKYVIEDTCWFSIELEYHMKPEYTKYEQKQLIGVFGRIPEQEILILGECDRIFVVAYEIITHFGGLLGVNLSQSREEINLYSGRKIEIHKIRHKCPEKFEPAYWLVDQTFIRDYFINENDKNFKKFKIEKFLFYA